ncbi:MAG: SMP-30/gluconolactonase/LRE family protein [Rubellimicrobium sp.]|nr:SMP-30/gluconolactonase/LRE family protein [Rubellimicrobium sp.]
MTMTAECVLDCRNSLGEGIIWDAAEQVLWWVDVPMPSAIHRLDPVSGDHRTWPCPEIVTALSKRRDGTLLVASHHGLNVFDPKDGSLKRVAAPEADKPQNRSNDGDTDPAGRFWFGTMCNNIGADGSDIGVAENSGVLYRVGADMVPVPMLGGIGIYNATCFAPDGRTMYFADTMADTIWACDLDPALGALSNRRVLSDDTGHGHPDGCTVDAEGYLWSARWEGSCVLRIAPDGRIDRKIEVPAARITCCAFGGADLDTLYITSSRANLPADELARTPQAGGIFAVRPGVKGVAAPQFAG